MILPSRQTAIKFFTDFMAVFARKLDDPGVHERHWGLSCTAVFWIAALFIRIMGEKQHKSIAGMYKNCSGKELYSMECCKNGQDMKVLY